ncbi:MAG: hypothetical protein ACR2PS_19035, partial [Pseudomonadales bacterium]
MVITNKRLLISFWVLAYVLLGMVIISISASCLFFLVNRTMPSDLAIGTYAELWSYYKNDSVQSTRLYMATGFSALMVYVAPLFLLLDRDRQTRSLHGDARFANDKEIRKSGLY